ncbi:hypothetical protein MLD38_003786 [Melastoma candidum]|uniref:Uncharacterized protein n=1 Tax=Melastoma candidum TaxID=119954 RepID=A0ACB9SC68_9MYRT|nr:hypothetical protein MLD38_003786 [Melastoma candidum]
MEGRDGLSMKRRAKKPSDLPEQILGDILCRLPVRSLVRFRCVSRSWNSLLSSHAFIKAHLKRSSELHAYDLVKFNDSAKSRLVICGVSSNEIKSLGDCCLLDQKIFQRFDLIDSCNGVLCLSTFQKDSPGNSSIILYNPSIREYKVLPQPSSGLSEFIGFGLDISTGYLDDLKIINVKLTLGTYPNLSSKVEVYSARKNSWKQLGDVFPMRQTMFLGKQVLFDKYICWCPYARLRCQVFESNLLMYDLVRESFSEMVLPSTMPLEKKYVMLLDGFLSIIACKLRSRCYDVWTIKDFSIPESWTMLYTIKDATNDIFNYRPLGSTCSGNIIFVRCFSSEQGYGSPKDLVSYKRESGWFEDLNLEVDSFYSSRLVRYVDSINFPSY